MILSFTIVRGRDFMIREFVVSRR